MKAEQRTPPDELAPVINTLVEVVDMTGDAESDSDLMRELFGSFKEDEDMQEIDEYAYFAHDTIYSNMYAQTGSFATFSASQGGTI